MTAVPVVRGGLCLSVDPDGCVTRVRREVAVAAARLTIGGPRRVLVIGCSAGLGLSTRIAVAFSCGAETVGVHLDRPPRPDRPGAPGWYNAAAVRAELAAAGRSAVDVHGDAFADDTKQRTLAALRASGGPVDLVVYSVAAPQRTDPVTGRTHRSTIAAVGADYTDLSHDVGTGEIRRVTLPRATRAQVTDTVAVLGGDDWARWDAVLRRGGVLASDAVTVAFTYVGPSFLERTYRRATVGMAKRHVEQTAGDLGPHAIAVAAAPLVTQASSVIPVQTLYTAILDDVLGERAPTPATQARDLLAALGGTSQTDAEGRLRLDSAELDVEVQAEVRARWSALVPGMYPVPGLAEYRARLLALHGFGFPDAHDHTTIEEERVARGDPKLHSGVGELVPGHRGTAGHDRGHAAG